MLNDYESPYSSDYQVNIIFETDDWEADQEELDDFVYEPGSSNEFLDLPGREEAEG